VLRTGLVLALALAGTAQAARSAGTRIWAETPRSLALGSADGVAVSASGHLFMAPRIERMDADLDSAPPHHVWSMTGDGRGNIYLGTGPDGHVLRITPGGSLSVFFTVDEPLVTALAITGDGDLLAGTAPGGKVYRVDGDGTGGVWAETDERYVWSLAVTAAGEVFAATGEHGGVVRLDQAGRPEPFFDSGEPHVVSLAALPGGGLLAGGAGGGLVYEIDEEGNAIVHYDAELPEATALTSDGEGGILAALVAPPSREAEPPALKITLPDGTQVGTTDETVGALEQRRGPVLRGTIEGLKETRDTPEPPLRGRIVRIDTEGRTTELWRSGDEAPFCLIRDSRGNVLFGTGEPARLYRLDRTGDVALLGTLDEAQITGLLDQGRVVFVATSNPAAVYRVETQSVETGVFTSHPLDAGEAARWGSIRWRVDGGSGRVELYTRTGNSRDPDRTWSGWSPVLTDPAGSRIVNPDGRFFQWRARFVGAEGAGIRLSGVRVSYELYNRPPRVRDFRLEGGVGAVSGGATLLWSASDPDGDPVELRVERRTGLAEEWTTVGSSTTGGEGPSGPPHRGRLEWDTTQVAEGRYEIRAVASDQAANDPDEGHEVDVSPTLELAVDRSPPRLSIQPQGPGAFDVRVEDTLSPVRRLEVLAGGATRFSLRPVDGVCDSGDETFRVVVPADGVGWSVRGADAAGNAVEEPLPAP
jgi:hypothetical protein